MSVLPPEAGPATRPEQWIDDEMRRMAQRAEIFERILHRSPGILLVARREASWPFEYLSSNVDRLGYKKRELLESEDGFLSLVHEDDRDRVEMEANYWAEHAERNDFRMEFRCRTQRGEVRWMDTHLWLRRDAEGRVRRIQGVAWDISERKRAERLQRLAVQVVELLNCPDESSEIIRNILEMMRMYTDVEAAAIHLRQGDGSFVSFESGFQTTRPLDPRVCPLAASVLDDGKIVDRSPCIDTTRLERTPGGTLWTNSAEAHTCSSGETGCVGSSVSGTLAVIPLRAQGRTVGLLQLWDPSGGQCDAETIEAFEGLGFSIGIALDREQTTQRLARSEDRYRALFDTSRDGIVVLSLDQRVEAMNGAMESMTGRTATDLDEMSPWSVLHGSGRGGIEACIPGQLLSQGFCEDFEREVVRPDGHRTPVMCRAWTVRDDSGRPKRELLILRDVEEQRRAEREVDRLVTAIEQSAEIVIVTDIDSRIEYVNPTFEALTGYTRDEAMALNMIDMRDPSTPASAYDELRRTIRDGDVFKGRVGQARKDGSIFHVDQTVSPVRDETGAIVNFVAVQRDVTELIRLESQLLQAQKLESIGRLAAGIAHEINTPTQYVGDNVRFLKDAFEDFMRVMRVGKKLTEAALRHPELTALAESVQETVEDIDLDYLSEEIPSAIDQSLEGLGRVSRIVGAMKYFSHPGAVDMAPTDIHQAIESTVTVARNEWKYDCDLELDFDPAMPAVPCLANEFNQVILNLVINASHAIQGRHVEGDAKGNITIRTRVEAACAHIAIADDGTGMPEAIVAKIFDPFFTTKDVGSGTGQGLAIARDVIVTKHGGSLDVETELGVGTTFHLRLPLVRTEALVDGGEPCDA